jgi:hypothetical protein|tara:strand:+ start:242 stop:472 length:231 start_codon:yes stop_codon:yes gene_type:complete
MKLKQIKNNVNVLAFNDGTQVLFSYRTPVAGRTANFKYVRTSEYYSKTTSRHINQWLGSIVATTVTQTEIDKLADR